MALLRSSNSLTRAPALSRSSALLTLDYALVDVFAEHPLEGNQLAIFTDARGLSPAQMQALARETNLSETTFILPRDPATEAREGIRVRIFSTEEEFPFAGHPTLGTAAWLHLHHPTLAGAPTVTLALNVGPVPVTFNPAQPGPGVYGTMRQPDPVFGATHPADEVAPILGLDPADLLHPAEVVSTGMPFCIAMLRSPEALRRLRIPQSLAEPWLARAGAKFFYCLAPAGPEARFRARMQFYGAEDPATGSAAGCAAAWLVRHNLLAPDTPAVLEQGAEILRPSRLTVRASRTTGGNIHDVFVAGRTISVASGRFFLP